MRIFSKAVSFLIFFLGSQLSLAQSPPAITSLMLADADLFRVNLQGQNFDAQSYVDIRYVGSSGLVSSIVPPQVSYTAQGGSSGQLTLRIEDVALRNKLTLEGLRFYVVSPTANYAFAGPVTLQRSWPLPTLTGGQVTPAGGYNVALTGENCDANCYVDIRTLNGTSIAQTIVAPNLTYTSTGATGYRIDLEVADAALRGLLTSEGLRFYVVSPSSAYRFAGPKTVQRVVQVPVISNSNLADADLFRVNLQGQNFDAQSYVDIRYVGSSGLVSSIVPPQVSYTAQGGSSGQLTLRIEDVALRNKLTLEGLRFYVVSPTANYAFAGPVTLQRSWPVPTLTGGQVTPAGGYNVALTGENCDANCYVDIRTLNGTSIAQTIVAPNLTYTSAGATGYRIDFDVADSTLRGLLTSEGLRFYVVSPSSAYRFAGPRTVQRFVTAFSVNINTPTNNASFSAPAAVNLSASAIGGVNGVLKVEFYRGATLVCTATSAPYGCLDSNLSAGSYSYSAKAFDNGSPQNTTTSGAVVINVTATPLPTVALTAPTNNASFNAPATINLAATAGGGTGGIQKVDFYRGSTLLCSDAATPYECVDANIAAGNYAYVAKAFDNGNPQNSVTSATNSVIVASVPATTVAVTATPATNLVAPATTVLSATVSPNTGVSSVQYLTGGNAITCAGGVGPAPSYTCAWQNIAAGTYSVIARATANGQNYDSPAISLNVVPGGSATVIVTAAPSTNLIAPASTVLSSTVTPTSGVSGLQYLSGGSAIACAGGLGAAPTYNCIWTGIAAGSYQVIARATVSGVAVDSAALTLTVNSAASGFSVPQAPTLAPNPGIDAASDSASAIAGEASSDGAGGATYTIPMELPPGRRGLTPQFALQYSSNAGEGELGRGFSLSGLSVISRCRKTIEHGDTAPFYPLSFDNAKDRFCVDGQRLLLVKGANGDLNSEYRTEIDNFTKYVVTQAGPLEFKAYAPDGSIATYGARQYSFQNETAGVVEKTLAWMVSSRKDSWNNEITFSYLSDGTDGSISFTGAQYVGGSMQVNRIELAQSQQSLSYVNGARFSKKSQVTDVVVKDRNGNAIQNYRFSITAASNNAASYRLNRVDLCAGNQQVVCKQPTLFTYAPELNLSAGNVIAAPRGDWADGKVRSVKPGDFDGDGRPELFDLAENRVIRGRKTLQNSSGALQFGERFETQAAPFGFGSKAHVDDSLSWFPVDLTNDHRVDLVTAFAAYNNDTPNSQIIYWIGMLNNGSLFTSGGGAILASESYIANIFAPAHGVLADLNGDSVPEFLSVSPHNSAFKTATGQIVNDKVQFGGQINAVLSGIPGCSFTGTRTFQTRFRAFDANADGKSEILVRATDSANPCTIVPTAFTTGVYQSTELIGDTKAPLAANEYWILLSNESVAGQAPQFVAYAAWKAAGTGAIVDSKDENFRLEDLNNDGLIDVLYALASTKKWYYQLNTGRLSGSGTIAPFSDAQCLQRQSANSDICADINDTDEIELMDFDGDGHPDFWEPEGGGDHNYRVHMWLGNQFAPQDQYQLTDYQAQQGGNYKRLLADLDGDTVPENLWVDLHTGDTGKNRLARAKRHHQPHSLLLSVDNGLGKTSSFEYGLTTFSDLYRNDFSMGLVIGRAQSRVIDSESPQWLLKRVRESSPTVDSPSAERSTRFRYVGQKIQAGGRGSLGFRIVESLDEQKLIQTRTEFRQDFPFIGKPVRITTTLLPSAWAEACLDPDSATCMKPCSIVNVSQCNDFDALPSSAKVLSVQLHGYLQRPSQSVPGTILTGVTPTFVYPQAMVTQSFDLQTTCTNIADGQTCNERKLTREEMYPTGLDDFGNFTDQLTVMFERQNLPNGQPQTSDTQVAAQRVVRTFSNLTDTVWQLGLVTNEKSTAERDGASVVREKGAEFDASGHLLRSTVEPSQNALGVTLHVLPEYDAYGNTIKTRTCSNHAELVSKSFALCKATNASSTVPAGVSQPEYLVRRYQAVEFDGLGLYPTVERAAFDGSNSVGFAASTVSARNAWGAATTSLDANGVRTVAYINSFGKAFASATALGNRSTVRVERCTTVYCPPTGVVRSQVIDDAGADSWSYLDALGRDVLGISQTLQSTAKEARFLCIAKGYDWLGRNNQTSQPYFCMGPEDADPGNSTTVVFTTFTEFDVLDRATSVTNPDGGVISNSYDKFATTMTLPKNTSGQTQTRIERKNAMGEVKQVTDAAGLVVAYSYSPFGELRTLSRPSDTQSAPPIVTSISFDNLGRKLSMTDPDKGSYAYVYNAAGELIEERHTDTSGTCTRYSFDRLGRKRSRDDFANSSCTGTAAQTASFTFDTATKGLGQLANELASANAIPIVSRSYEFDSYARPSKTTTYYGTTRYASRSVFDQYSRPFQSFFQAVSDGLAETGEYFEYAASTGIQIAVRDAAGGTTGAVYSQVRDVDSFGNVVVEERNAGGVAIKTSKQFNPATGLTEQIKAGTSTSLGAIQNLDYRWDLVGNMIYRDDQSSGRSLYEAFSYDAQQRLLTQKRGTNEFNATTSVLTLTYSKLGNILSRNSQIYTYSNACGAGPHAVSNAQGNNYCYDSRGNQTSSSEGRTLVYAPFDLPTEIRTNNTGVGFIASTAFEYGPNLERVARRQYPGVLGITGVPTETVHFAGGAEIHRRSTGVEVKRYVGGIQIVQTSSQITKRYQWFDHQGSVTAITDLQGNPVGNDAQMSYDAFGLRREVVGTDFSLLRFLSFNTQATTRHGYTGHEMVDEAGLIHMNGRMYDPRLARFIQGDPMVQDPTNSQSLNRYSYVMNNPLNATDPTGMFSLGGGFSLFPLMFGAGGGMDRAICPQSSPNCNGLPAKSTWVPSGAVQAAFNNGVSIGEGLGRGGIDMAYDTAKTGAFGTLGPFGNLAESWSERNGFIPEYLVGPPASNIGNLAYDLAPAGVILANPASIVRSGAGAVRGVLGWVSDFRAGQAAMQPVRMSEALFVKLEPEAANYGTTVDHATGVNFGALTRTGTTTWESSGGLRYGPDPNYGDRVQHVLRHAVDDPLRVGKNGHGVFDAGPSGTLRVIDEAWQIAQRRGANVNVSVQGTRTTYNVNMGMRVGYVGGQSGGAAGLPAADNVRIVVEGANDLITAFPFR